MQQFLNAIVDLWNDSGIARLMNFEGGGWKNLIMIAVACVLLYLAIKSSSSRSCCCPSPLVCCWSTCLWAV